jgi:hypothetical protein
MMMADDTASHEDVRKRAHDQTTEPHTQAPEKFTADDVDAGDPHKAEKLAKAGRDDHPQEASE